MKNLAGSIHSIKWPRQNLGKEVDKLGEKIKGFGCLVGSLLGQWEKAGTFGESDVGSEEAIK